KGMKMRLNLCRALLPDPELLFVDEPTSGLDPVTARRVRAMIAAVRERGRTVLINTHNMAEATELCDRVGFVVDGTLALTGAPRALMLAHGERRVRVEYEGEVGAERRCFALDDLGEDDEFLALLREARLNTI